jgi:hypothetical protein
MRHNLQKSGLSLSQAASISNLCNQRAQEITNALAGVNNASKTFKSNGDTYTLEAAKALPGNVKEMLIEKGELHAAQAFLMSNIKAKDALLLEIKRRQFSHSIPTPEKPTYVEFSPTDLVSEEWAWDMLSQAEFAEYLEQEAYAAHVGQFIHKGGLLDDLRRGLNNVKALDFIELELGRKTPVKVDVHHKADELLKTHEELATLHRSYEMRVNYFKAKVKNLVTEENARISKENAVKQAEANVINAKLRQEYSDALAKFNDTVKVEFEQFEGARQASVQETAALRIGIDPRFQKTIDKFLKDLGAES